MLRTLRREIAQINALALAQPFVEGAEAAGGNEDAHDFAGGRVHNVLLLKVWELAALGLHVRVRDVMGGVWLFASDDADFCHIVG